MIDPRKFAATGMRPAAIMMICSVLAFSAASSYVPPDTEVLSETEAAVIPEPSAAVFKSEVPEETENETEPASGGYVPEPWLLNLAYQYPENSEESYAAVLMKELIGRDSAWYSSIYDLAGVSPSEMAVQLGKDPASVLGAYNPLSAIHDEADPGTWAVEQFRNVSVSFYDGSGHTTSAVSNAQDILSMASVYSYYSGMDDIGQIRSYMNMLWNASHSYQVSMSAVYYCDGCVDPSQKAEEQNSSELSGEDRADVNITMGTAAASEPASAEVPAGPGYDISVSTDSDAAGETGKEATSGEKVSLLQKLLSDAAESIASEESAEEGENTAEYSPEETAGSGESAGSEALSGESATAGPESSEETVSELPETAGSQTTPPQAPPDSSDAHPEQVKKICPGHVDLNITANIISLSGSPGLISLDASAAGESGSPWAGWTEENISAARQISGENWTETYGIEITAPNTKAPLSAAEIDSYISQLPESTSEERRELIRFALQSVGKIPYYWGGKASSADYGGNGFGTIVAPDHKGRILRGLDCSGWISWVYWSVTGERPASQSTDGLSSEGRAIARQELRPGDIAVITGETPHAVMFMNWTSDGQILCIHESGTNNNVTVSTMTADWPYYRNLID